VWRSCANQENLLRASLTRGLMPRVGERTAAHSAIDVLKLILVIILNTARALLSGGVMRSCSFVATALVTALLEAAPAGAAAPEQSPLAEPARTNPVFENLNIWGYGELHYARPSRDEGRTVADMRRAVFGLGYRFSPRVVFNSEWEVEHAIASADDGGEFEIEQFYVDFEATNWLTVTGGLFLMPFGFINEHHEPTQYYGVQRDFIETLIIPSTWREGGISVHGNTRAGLGWSIGVVTGNNFRGWQFDSVTPTYVTAFDLENKGPLQQTHQELQRADASHLSGYVALNHHGIPGLLFGGAVISGNATKVPLPLDARNPGQPRVSLWEGHARWTPGRFDLAVLYAGGHISNTAAANAANPDATNPIPASFNGFYAQAAYSVYQDATFRLTPFVRWETYSLGSSYEGTTGPVVPPGPVPVSDTPGDVSVWPRNNDRVWTAGANFYVTPQVVVKIDYQWFANNTNFDRLDLGLGLAF
jgi:hypothetical protein